MINIIIVGTEQLKDVLEALEGNQAQPSESVQTKVPVKTPKWFEPKAAKEGGSFIPTVAKVQGVSTNVIVEHEEDDEDEEEPKPKVRAYHLKRRGRPPKGEYRNDPYQLPKEEETFRERRCEVCGILRPRAMFDEATDSKCSTCKTDEFFASKSSK